MFSSGGPAHPLPFGPSSWKPDEGGLLYAASNGKQADSTAWLLGGGGSTALYTVDPAMPVPRQFSNDPGHTPAWLPDGSVLALARGKGNGPLLMRHIEGDAPPVDGPPLWVSSGPMYGAKWDMAHAQALIVVRSDGLGLSGNTDQYWLAQFRPDGRP